MILYKGLLILKNIYLGAFAKFDARGNNFAEPETNGVVGGSFLGGQPSYVGYGNNWGQLCKTNPCPGRISTDPVKKGTYLTCAGEVLDIDYAYYLLKHDDLRWIETDHIAMRSLPGAISVTSTNGYPFLFGRIKVGNKYTLGKVHNGNGAFKFNFNADDGTEADALYGFEVLVCNSAIPKPAV